MTISSSIPPYAPISLLPAYQAGRSADVVAEEHGLAEAIKLASNESPFGPLPSVAGEIIAAIGSVNRYPDVSATPLRAALAERHGLEVAEVTVGAGSTGVLYQLSRAYLAPGEQVVMHTPSFEAYPIIATLAQAEPVTVPLRDGYTDVEALAAAVTPRTKIVLVADPHNPTGTAIAAERLRWLADQLAGRCLLVIDQAYHEYGAGSGDDLALLHRDRPHVLILRTFSKAYGLAALRVGYGVAAFDVINALERVSPPFGVNDLGIVAACASLDATDELRVHVDQVVAERRRLEGFLRSLGVPVPPSEANFVWLPAGPTSGRLALALERRGVVTRPVGDFGVRVTIGLRAENDRFIESFVSAATEIGLDATSWTSPH